MLSPSWTQIFPPPPHIGSVPQGKWLVPVLAKAKAVPRRGHNESDSPTAAIGLCWSSQGNTNVGSLKSEQGQHTRTKPAGGSQARILSFLPKALLRGHTSAVKIADSYEKTLWEGKAPK